MRTILLLLISFPLLAAPVSVLDPAFDRLDRDALNRTIEKYKLKAPLTAEEKNEEVLNYFFLAERAYFESQPHEYAFYLNKAEKICELNQLEEVSARFTLSCALVYSELSQSETAFSKLIHIQKANALLLKAKKQVDPSEVYYVEARVLLASSEPVAPRLGKSILNLQMLLRTHPELSETSYWITYAYQLSGNVSAFNENRTLALKANNLRSQLKYGRTQTHLRAFNQGVNFGNRFGLYASQLDGVGALYKIWDDKIFDQRRAAAITLNASTRKNLGAKIQYKDAEVIEDYQWGIGTGVAYSVDEYFGLGMDSKSDDKSIYRFQTWNSHFEFTRELVPNFDLSIGWAFHQRHLSDLIEGPLATLANLSGDNQFYSGGYLRAELNLLEAEDYSLSGGRVRLRGYFPAKDLLSNCSFQKWNMDAEIHTHFWATLFKLALATSSVSDDAPFDALVEVKSDLYLPGVRASRYRDKHLSGGALELKHKLMGPFVLGAYSSAVTSQFDLSKSKVGFGGLLEVYLTSLKTKQARVEVGSFNGEFIFALDLGLGL